MLLAVVLPLVVFTYIADLLCTNECPSAFDGTCDDGAVVYIPDDPNAWPMPANNSKCRYATDCGDCGQRPIAVNRTFTVCKPAAPDGALTNQVKWRLGSAADPHSKIYPRATLVNISCINLKGCTGCEDMPGQLPFGFTDVATTYVEGEYLVSFSRSFGEANIGLQPDWWLSETCVEPWFQESKEESYKPHLALSVPWHARRPKAIFRGASSGELGPFQVDHNISWKVFREDFKEKVAGMGNPAIDVDGSESTLEYQVGHRCIFYLEGNDVGSAIYWLLGSGALILAPETLTAEAVWKIEPWVHYVPFKTDLSDLEDIVQRFCVRDGASPITFSPEDQKRFVWAAPSLNLPGYGYPPGSPGDGTLERLHQAHRRTRHILGTEEVLAPVALDDEVLDDPSPPPAPPSFPPGCNVSLCYEVHIGGQPKVAPPSESDDAIIRRVLLRARAYFDDMCDVKREAQRQYLFLTQLKAKLKL